MQKWAKDTPRGFIFVLKALQDITHKYRLSIEAIDRVHHMYDRARQVRVERERIC